VNQTKYHTPATKQCWLWRNQFLGKSKFADSVSVFDTTRRSLRIWKFCFL
jgi:hypothetical protein